MRKRILFLFQLPPPIHGASTVNQFIADSKSIHGAYETRIMPLMFAKDAKDIGAFSVRKVWRMITFLYRLLIQLIVFKPHLVYFTLSPKGGAFYRDAIYVFFIKLLGRKLAYHLHSRGIQKSIQHSSVKRRIYKYVFSNTYVIALADSLLVEFEGLNIRKFLIVKNGIADHRYNLSQRGNKSQNILFLSNLFINKGVLVFIEAIEMLAGRYDLRADIVGSEGDLSISQLNEIIMAKGLHQKLFVHGPQYGKDKYRFFEEASIYVMPSLDEAFPLTILEAMQASLPVVASAVGGIPEIIEVGKNGFLCEPGNVQDLVFKVEKLLESESLRDQIGENARRSYESTYTIQAFEGRLKMAIDEILQGI